MRQAVFREFFILSATLESLSFEENHNRTRELFNNFLKLGVNFASCKGVYNGKNETSFMIFDTELEKVSELARAFGQESFIHRTIDGHGSLCFEDRKEDLGEVLILDKSELTLHNSYTVLPQQQANSEKYFTFKKVQ